MEIIVLDVRNHSVRKHVLVVLQASVSGIGDDLAALQTVFLMKRFEKIDERTRIRRSLKV